jgi:hypothetical protein
MNEKETSGKGGDITNIDSTKTPNDKKESSTKGA